MVEKVIRDGKVAVLYSPGFGAGWSTWNMVDDHQNIALFHPKIVNMVEAGKASEIDEEWIEREFGIDHSFYCGGSSELKIEWISLGKKFVVVDYDGSEQIITEFHTA